MTSQAALGSRVRRLRVAAGLGQVELADRIGLASGSISMLENGRLPVDGTLLQSLAGAFDCTIEYFVRQAPEPLTTRPWLRAYADAPKRSVDRMLADSTLAVETVDYLQLQRLPDIMPLFDGDPNSDDDVETFALDVRAAAGLGSDDVVGNAMRAAERLGCLILPMENELGRHLGLSLRVDSTPVIRVSRPSLDVDRDVPGDRQRFTTAHELGHLVLHHAWPPPDSAAESARIEQQAHRFAAAFLAPADALVADLERLGGRVTLTTLAKLKETWGVAIKALVVRFQHLGVIDSDHARSLYKQISARRWNKSEPVTVGNEEAIWLSRALSKRAKIAERPLAEVAQQSALGAAYFQRWTTWGPTESEMTADVIAMPQRPPASRRSGRTGGGPVQHLRVRR